MNPITHKQGSLGIPPEMKAALEKKNARPVETPSSQDPVPGPALAQPEVADEQTKKVENDKAEAIAKVAEFKQKIEERYEYTLNENDIKDYIFKARLTKEITVVPGYMRGVFQTLTPTDLQAIDEHMADFRSNGKFTDGGIQNEQALVTLSYAWIAAGAPGSPMRPFASVGKDQDIAKFRLEVIRKMSAMIVDKARVSFNEFNDLINIMLGEKTLLKKS